MQNQDALIGYIGENYQRFYIRFISIIKDKQTTNEYYVYGKSRVKNIICDFQGKIKITSAYEFDKTEWEMHYHEAFIDDNYLTIDNTEYVYGVVLAEYFLIEDDKQANSGIFHGFLKSYYYSENENFYFNDLNMRFDDNYCNNQFCGVWKSFSNGITKTCNWGICRIPNAKDLDIGAGEFSPSEKYYNSDWNSYYKAYFESDSAAIKQETTKWWE